VAAQAGTQRRGVELTPLEQLRATLKNAPPSPDAMDAYLEKVHLRAYAVTDGDVQALKDAGISEDQIFEQTVAAAISEGLYRLDAARRVTG
jgi:alkylhydroperoxidase family enzyme